MAILDEDVARVRQAADLVEVIGEHVALRKSGRRWSGLCPFHAEKSPSFSVNAEEGLYYCFGCQAKGDVITFMRDVEHLTFVEAVERLAGKYSIELRYDNQAASREHKRRAVLIDAMARAVDWYHDRLLKSPDAGGARAYLRERGYDAETVRAFKLGWAPDSWDELCRALRLPDDVLRDTGLGFVNRRGRKQDSFRARVLFPIFDVSGAAVAFGGRILPGAEGPKYKNSSETPLYAKSRTLYALNWSKQSVVERDEVVVCEGYTDVIGFFNAGVPRAVATCGTALTEEHVRTLKNFATRIVLAYDADSAGQAAADRFYEWEKKLGIDIAVANLPAGADPADIARRDPAALQAAVTDAKPFLGFRISRLLAAADLRSVEGRARAAEACAVMIAEHPSEFVRDQYTVEVADRCRVDVERMRKSVDSGGAVGDARPARVVDVRSNRPAETIPLSELEVLRVAIHMPEEVLTFFDQISVDDLTGLEEVLFSHDTARAAFGVLASAATLTSAIELASPDASDLLTRIAAEEEPGPTDALVRIVERAAHRRMAELEREVRQRPDLFSEVGPVMGWMKLETEQLRSPDASQSAAAISNILEWLLNELNSQPGEMSNELVEPVL